jgi:hypothetical protein
MRRNMDLIRSLMLLLGLFRRRGPASPPLGEGFGQGYQPREAVVPVPGGPARSPQHLYEAGPAVGPVRKRHVPCF